MFSDDKSQVDDLFQDVMVKLWSNFDSFRGESDIRTWIYRVSLNSCLDHQARQKRRGTSVSLTDDLAVPDESDVKAMQVRQLYSRISGLGLVDRGIVLLWLEGLSYDEIATIVGISASNVSVRLVRIKNRLMKMSDQ